MSFYLLLSTFPLLCKALCALIFELFFFSCSSFFKINIYRYRLSVCEVSLQEFPVWGPRPLTRLNLPFQMKAALRETVLFGRAAEPLPSDSRNVGCLEWGSGSEERMPSMSMFVQGWLSHSAPSDVLRGPASIKGARLASQNSDQLLYRS